MVLQINQTRSALQARLHSEMSLLKRFDEQEQFALLYENDELLSVIINDL